MAQSLLRFIEMFRGSSFPTLSATTTGQLCVIKMKGVGNGAGALLSELVVNRLAHAIGLPVPDAFVVRIPAGFPWSFGTDEFQDLVKKSAGPNLGLEWLADAKPLPPGQYSSLPSDFISQVVTLDLVFLNFDRSSLSNNLLEGGRQKLWIIDHGSCRFLFPIKTPAPRLLPADHIFSGRENAFEPRWLNPITPALIAETAGEIPDEWLGEMRLTRMDLIEAIEARLRFAQV